MRKDAVCVRVACEDGLCTEPLMWLVEKDVYGQLVHRALIR